VDSARRGLDLLAHQGILSRTYEGAVAPEEPAPKGRKRMLRVTSSFEKTRLAQFLDHGGASTGTFRLIFCSSIEPTATACTDASSVTKRWG
jgi:hypothetical protein